jgi:hypothetical protein
MIGKRTVEPQWRTQPGRQLFCPAPQFKPPEKQTAQNNAPERICGEFAPVSYRRFCRKAQSALPNLSLSPEAVREIQARPRAGDRPGNRRVEVGVAPATLGKCDLNGCAWSPRARRRAHGVASEERFQFRIIGLRGSNQPCSIWVMNVLSFQKSKNALISKRASTRAFTYGSGGFIDTPVCGLTRFGNLARASNSTVA